MARSLRPRGRRRSSGSSRPGEVDYSATEVTLQWTDRPSPDLNGDGLIDLKDYALFQSCYAGSGEGPSALCAKSVNADLDQDGDIDHNDYSLLFAAITQ